MSKIAENKAREAYPTPLDNEPFISKGFVEEKNREGYIKGYDQAMQDLLKDANQYMFLSDEIGYVYACGCRKTMQDLLEKAEEFLYFQLNNGSIECGNIENLIKQFKNYMQDESN